MVWVTDSPRTVRACYALSGSSTYSGPTVVNGGTLSLLNGASINGGAPSGSGVNLAAASTVLVFNHTDSQTFAPTVSGPGGLVQTGGGIVTLANSNTYTGNTAITGGTLALGNPLALQNSTLNTSVSGTLSFGSLTAATLGGLAGPGTLALGNTASAPVTLSVGNNNANTTFSGMMTGPGSLTMIGTGALTLTGTNSFSGTTSASSGTVIVANALALENSTLNIAAGAPSGSIVFSVSAASVGGLSGAGNLNLGAAVLTVGANNASLELSGLAQRRQWLDQGRRRHARHDRDEHVRRAHGHRRGHAATRRRDCRLRRQYVRLRRPKQRHVAIQ